MFLNAGDGPSPHFPCDRSRCGDEGSGLIAAALEHSTPQTCYLREIRSGASLSVSTMLIVSVHHDERDYKPVQICAVLHSEDEITDKGCELMLEERKAVGFCKENGQK